MIVRRAAIRPAVVVGAILWLAAWAVGVWLVLPHLTSGAKLRITRGEVIDLYAWPAPPGSPPGTVALKVVFEYDVEPDRQALGGRWSDRHGTPVADPLVPQAAFREQRSAILEQLDQRALTVYAGVGDEPARIFAGPVESLGDPASRPGLLDDPDFRWKLGMLILLLPPVFWATQKLARQIGRG